MKKGGKVMHKSVRIQMLGEFVIEVNGQETLNMVSKTRKGVALMVYLALNNGKWVPKQRLLNTLWSVFQTSNPESALKTLISRLRKTLNDIHAGLGKCIESEKGGYRWNMLPDMQVDLLTLVDLFNSIPREPDQEKRLALHKTVRQVYTGDLCLAGDFSGGVEYATTLHNQFLRSVYDEIELLKLRESFNEIADICQQVLKIDALDDRIHLERMQALASTNRIEEAKQQYRRASDINEKYLDSEPTEELTSLYKQLLVTENELKLNIDSMKNELQQEEKKQGAYKCDYDVFREIYNMQMCNMKRLGATMFLGLIMLYEMEDISTEEELEKRKKVTDILVEVIRSNLRRGDIVSKYSDTCVAVLLTAVDYTTGSLVMERIHQLFEAEFPKERIPFHFRLGELR